MKKILLSLMIVFGLAACGDKAEAPKENEKPVVKIGVIYPFSGSAAVFGESAKAAVQIFQNIYSKKLSNVNFEFYFEDDQFQPSKAVLAAQRLTNIHNVNVLISFVSQLAIPVSEVAKSKNVLHLTLAKDPDVADGKNTFLITADMDDIVAKMSDKMIRSNVKKVSSVVLNASGTLFAYNSIKEGLKKHNIEISQEFFVNPSEKDFSLMIAKIRENNPDIIFLQTHMPETDIFLKQYKEANMNIPITGNGTLKALQTKELGNGLWEVDDRMPSDEFLNEYKKVTDLSATNLAEHVYSLLVVLGHAYDDLLKTNFTVTTQQLTDYMKKTKIFEGTPFGNITIKENGVMGVPGQVLYMKDGREVGEE